MSTKDDITMSTIAFLGLLQRAPGLKVTSYTIYSNPGLKVVCHIGPLKPKALLAVLGPVWETKSVTCDLCVSEIGNYSSSFIDLTGTCLGIDVNLSIGCYDGKLGELLGASTDGTALEITAEQWIAAHKQLHAKPAAEVTA